MTLNYFFCFSSVPIRLITLVYLCSSNSFQKNRSNSQISQEKQKKGDYDNDLASNSVQETISAENIMGKYKNTKEFDTLSNDSYQSIESERDKFSSAPSRRGTLLDTKSVMNRLDSFLKDCGHDKETRDLVINSLTVSSFHYYFLMTSMNMCIITLLYSFIR